MTRFMPLLQRGAALLLLPLSVIPFLLLGPQIAESHRNFDRMQKAAPLAVPAIALTNTESARWQPIPPYTGAVPVLAYRGIDDARRSPLSVTRAGFARQMAMLAHAGFHAISIEDYARFRRGESVQLPSRPVLITFDEGRLDSYRGADRVLQRHGFEATMFVITGKADRRDPFYLTWAELHKMERSGRWQVQPQAARGSGRVAVDSAGRMGDFYANRRFTRSEGEETFAAWQSRVTRDIFDARDAMLDQGFTPVAVSVPRGNYGQLDSNDARIAPYLRSVLSTQFGVVLAGDAWNTPAYSRRTGDALRYEAHAETRADDVYRWLRDHNPALPRKGARR
jgi:hypothetical protein